MSIFIAGGKYNIKHIKIKAKALFLLLSSLSHALQHRQLQWTLAGLDDVPGSMLEGTFVFLNRFFPYALERSFNVSFCRTFKTSAVPLPKTCRGRETLAKASR